MAKRPAPPSGVSQSASAPENSRTPGRSSEKKTGRVDASPRRVDVGGWLGGMRISAFAVIMLGLVVLAAFTLVPTVGNYIQQRERITALEKQVQLTTAEVADLEAQRERLTDPAYITTQARERLYYVHPGEVIFLVVNDLPADAQPQAEQQVSADVTQTRTDWMTQLLASVGQTGLAQTVTGTPAP